MQKLTSTLCCLLLLLTAAAEPPAAMAAYILLVDDPLTNGITVGQRNGGVFVTGGWKTTDCGSCIRYTLAPTVTSGKWEFDVTGLAPLDPGYSFDGIGQLCVMDDGLGVPRYYLDVTKWGGQCGAPWADAVDLRYMVAENSRETWTSSLSWDPLRTYHFMITWEVGLAKLYRDGVLLLTTQTPGVFRPLVHNARIGSGSYIDGWIHDMGIPNAVYSNVAIYAEGVPPVGPVTNFVATSGMGQVTLSWRNPSEAAFTGTVIRYSADGYPATPNGGTLVVDKQNSPDSIDSYVQTGLTNGIKYYYAAFAHDATPTYASPAYAWTVAGDVIAPGAMISGPSVVATRTGPVTYTANWDEPVTGFDSSDDIQINSTGSASCGSVSVTGSGSGPYTITLSSITGNGTLGIAIPAGCCIDSAANPNMPSSPSTAFTVDNIAPTTSASPSGGVYASSKSVVLAADETATVYYTTNGTEPTTSSSVYSAPIQVSVNTTLRFFAIDPAGNQESPKKREVYTIIDADTRISGIKPFADGTPVTLGDKVLYLKQGYMGYIEEQDRSSGIRLQGEITASEDELVSLTGTMGTAPDGERYILVGMLTPGGSYTATPLGVNNRDLRYSLVDGLYVTTWGVVKPGSVTGDSFVLTDGSDDTGIMVSTVGDPGVGEGDYVTVTGAAGFDGLRLIYRR